jgi:hypothetical protein
MTTTEKTKLNAILVTGSRDWTDEYAIQCAMIDAGSGKLHMLLIHGDCRGADRVAAEYAKGTACWMALPMPAQWHKLGAEAGPDRNLRMIEVLKHLRACGYDCEVHAFPLPSSKGTRHMMRIAREAGFTVRNHGELE